MAADAGTVIQALRHTHQTDAGVPDALLTSPRRWYYRLTAGLVTLGLVALLLVWRDCPTPFVLGFLAAAGGAVATALFLSHARLQNIAVTFASSFLTLALIEGGIYVTTSSDIRVEMESKVPYYIADPDLGYGPQTGVKVEVRKYHPYSGGAIACHNTDANLTLLQGLQKLGHTRQEPTTLRCLDLDVLEQLVCVAVEGLGMVDVLTSEERCGIIDHLKDVQVA